jgi:uncharacterized protein (TIGR02646 family)
MCDEYDAAPQDYQTGQKKFEFDSDIYGAKSVKSALIDAQHDKCCFCESKISHISYGDVEHFRPKAGWVQNQGDTLSRPGYYWLAYDWSNLFLSCQLCNQRHKRNLFPLQNSDDRAASHDDPLDAEMPMFIKPDEEDPEQYISFRAEYAYAIDDNPYGLETIESLQLNREELVEMRRDRLSKLSLLKIGGELAADRIAAGDPDPQLPSYVANVDAELTAAQEPTAEYSAMAKTLLA